MKKALLNNRGFTLIEIMIGLMVSCVLVLGLTRLYSTMLSSYSLQEQLTEMNQNAKFTIKEISDVLMQAGADCAAINSDTLDKDVIVRPASVPCNDFTIKVNPRGGLYIMPLKIYINTTVKCSLAVDNASAFRCADSLEKIPLQTSARNIVVYKLDSIHSGTNYVYFHPASGITNDSFCDNDAIFSFVKHRYCLNGTTLCLDNDTLAENIDSLAILFFDKTGASLAATSTLWANVWSISIIVEARTSMPDNRYTDPNRHDHYRRLMLSNQFRLKNKV